MLKHSLILLSIIAFGASLWLFSRPQTQTLTDLLAPYEQAGTHTREDLSRIASLPIHEADGVFRMEDDGKQGIQIAYANAAETPPEAKEAALSLSFPQDLSKPIEIKLDEQRVITIEDTKNTEGFSVEKITNDEIRMTNDESWLQKLTGFFKQDPVSEPTYLSYQNQRKTILYTLKKDQATDEKQLKSWTLYQKGNGIEQEAYRIDHAQVRINEDGHAELFYQGDQELKNEAAKGEVEPSLLERAQRTLEKEMGEDILNSNQTPDLIIPKPFFYDKDGERHESDWAWDPESKTLSLELTFKDDLYPIALDPTLQFTAPATSNTGDVITGEASSSFGSSMATGDFNNDGKTDLAIGAPTYSSSTGRVYLFYQDGAMSTTAVGADVVIGGEAGELGGAITSGDMNADGKMDLIVGAGYYSAETGRVYIFYNDGAYPATAASADIIISGYALSRFGDAFIAADFNADGRTDLVVGGTRYNNDFTGRAYIFYNDGSIPTTAATADAIITGEGTYNYLGSSFAAGDFNADGKTDLVVGAYGYSSSAGRVYVFYSGSIVTENASGADLFIVGSSGNHIFGKTLAAGDFNTDGKTDLAVGAIELSSSNIGHTYIFYNDGSIPTTAATADVSLAGDGSFYGLFGSSLTAGDFNTDGRIDVAVGALGISGYSSSPGHAYIFYNDGAYPSGATTADVIITGETTNNFLGAALAVGDLNADGKTDLAVGSKGYTTNTGRAYIFYSQNGQVNTNRSISGETTNNYFGSAFASGDFNSDGRTDLAVGAFGYSSNTGRVYIFYNDGSIADAVSGADVTITGEAAGNSFGYLMASGDLNADSRTDLTVSTNAGIVYIFYNDGSYPSAAASADVRITSTGGHVAVGDMNADGRPDLVSGTSGTVHIFYNDGSYPATGASADVAITGGGGYGGPLVVGDFNTDGREDLAVAGPLEGPPTSGGYIYIFYNDGSMPTTTATADVTITGIAYYYVGSSLVAGDFNADGRTDLAAGAYNGSSAYIFYNDGSYPGTASSADIAITGSNYFGKSLAAGDFNADGRIDLAVGGVLDDGTGGKVSIFYNDGSIPTTAATADVSVSGEGSDYFANSLVAGDWNADGRTDLVVGAYGNTSNTGKIYFYETRENFAWKLQPVPLTTPFRTQTGSGAGEELSMTGEAASSLGNALVVGDFNADGKTDLAVGAQGYASSTGRVYIFYNDGSLATSATNADVVITGEATSNFFGNSFAAGDLNADGKTDLAVGAQGYSTNDGRAYIFYNDGLYPSIAANADAIIGGSTDRYFAGALVTGDFNADGKTDLAADSHVFSGGWGYVHIFYNDGSYASAASSADVIIDSSCATSSFGRSLVSGDFNADGRTDIAVGDQSYATQTGRVHIFYNTGSYPASACSSNLTIIGQAINNYFGRSLVSGDLNADGKTDLVVSASGYSSNTGRAYLFYNDGSIPTTAATADVIITGEATSNSFSISLASGDFNADGRTDLAVGADGYSTDTGCTHIFYNDGSIPTTAATADIILTGEAASNRFGAALVAGDLNSDGKTDLMVGAAGYASGKGKVYLYTWNDATITGEATNNYFGNALVSGDLNADGKTDLVVGAYGYSTNTGRAYIFYSDGSIPTTAATADVIITGETTGNYFGASLIPGDFNADGRTDLVVGARGYSTDTGRAYIFYNDGSYTSAAASADVIITGTTSSDMFSSRVTTGDLNSDGKIDLAVGAHGYNSGVGRVYIFWNDGSIPTTAATADVIITGDFGSGYSLANGGMATGDFNADGRIDLAVGGVPYNGYSGRVNIFYNDGSIPTTAATADAIIVGEAANNYFGNFLVAGDFNADGKTDLAVGSWGSSWISIFYNDGSYPALSSGAEVRIVGGGGFGVSLAAGDFNADGKTDLAVGADEWGGNLGRFFVFYNDGSYPSVVASADYMSEFAGGCLGRSLAAGDFNADGEVDIATGAWYHSSNTGRAYIITTEARTVDGQEKATVRKAVKFRGPVKIR